MYGSWVIDTLDGRDDRCQCGPTNLVVNQSGDSLAEAVGCDLGSSQSTHAVVVLGDESYGIPSEAMEILDLAVEIPMIGTGDRPQRRRRRVTSSPLQTCRSALKQPDPNATTPLPPARWVGALH
jgi:hypothetical protein